jgi:hypothetical protein
MHSRQANPDLSSLPQPFKRQHARLTLLGSPPDVVLARISPAGQKVNVRAETFCFSMSRSHASPHHEAD